MSLRMIFMLLFVGTTCVSGWPCTGSRMQAAAHAGGSDKPYLSLYAQRFNRIQPRRFPRRKQSGDGAGGAGGSESSEHCEKGQVGRKNQGSHHFANYPGQENSDGSAKRRQGYGLDQKLLENVDFSCAQ